MSSRGGLVVAGGDEMHVLRPGAERMASRPPPLDIGPIRVVAAEPRAPFRHAVASEELVAIFYRNEQGDQIMRLRSTPPGPSATHLAWGHAGGESTLYIRWSDGAVVRVKQDLSGIDTPDLAPMDAIAADATGNLALLSLASSAAVAYVTTDGELLASRPLPEGIARAGHVHLAIADTAVAFAVADGGVFVSRGEEAPFARCEPLASAGPVEFEGASGDAPLFGALNRAGVATILRVDSEGAAFRIADFESDAAGAPTIAGLAWDGSRHILWGASPQMGLVTCTAPDAKHGKTHLS